jgi:hypothetical protein
LREREIWRSRRPSPRCIAPAVGFGLSGGGIRSATFCLGVFQAFTHQTGLLGKIDYISSVSGGGFFASFYGRLFARPDMAGISDLEYILSPDQQKRLDFPDLVEPNLHMQLRNWKSLVFKWLRENGRYLAPNGNGDLLTGITVFLRNWLTIQLLISVTFLAIFLAAQLIRPFLPEVSARFATCFWWSPFFAVAIAMVVFLMVPTGWAYWAFSKPEPGTSDRNSIGKARVGELVKLEFRGLGVLLALTVSLLAPAIFILTRNGIPSQIVSRVWPVAALIVVLTFVAWQGSLLVAKSPPTPWRNGAFVVAGAVMLAIVGFAIWMNWGVGPLGGVVLVGIPVIMVLCLPTENRMSDGPDFDAQLINQSEMARTKLSRWLRTALILTFAVALFALIDSVGQTLFALSFTSKFSPAHWLVAFFGGAAAIVPFARSIVTFFAPGKNSRISLPLSLVVGLAAALVILPFLISIDAFSHAVAYSFASPFDAPPALMAKYAGRRNSRAECAKTPALLAVANASPKWQAIAAAYKNSGWRAAIGQLRILDENSHCRRLTPIVAFLAIAIAFTILTGSSISKAAWGFVNRTSLHPLYAARLIRAYLGASNRQRFIPPPHKVGVSATPAAVSDPVDGDDIPQEDYFRPPESFWAKGAPLHLVNVTINETIDGRSQTEERDRKGVGMAIGPAGFSVGIQHHLVIGADSSTQADGTLSPVTVLPAAGDGYRVFSQDNPAPGHKDSFSGQKLSLGHWTAISGAAVSTGLGSRNSLGASLLTGFFNVRLGFWWNSGTASLSPPNKIAGKLGKCFAQLLPVQSSLLDEFLGRFRGTMRRYWYLTDGGHFEDLAGYELIRRRLPLIVLIDAEADSDYDFAELSNLIRKARLDFDAEIEFINPDTQKDLFQRAMDSVRQDFASIRPQFFGTLDQLRRGKWSSEPVPERAAFFKSDDATRLSLRHAAVARVKYLDEPDTVHHLIVIKPTLIGEEPEDLLNYHSAHPAFPQETTAEQFFNEAQWESYRRLGQHIAERLFRLN